MMSWQELRRQFWTKKELLAGVLGTIYAKLTGATFTGTVNVTKTTGSANVATFTGSAGATEVDQYGNVYATGINPTAGVMGTGVVSYRIYNTANKDWRIETHRSAPAGSLEFTNITDASTSPRLVLAPDGNIAIGGVGSFGSGAKVLFIANATAPSSNPVGGGILYVEAGALKYRGSSGTITTLGAA